MNYLCVFTFLASLITCLSADPLCLSCTNVASPSSCTSVAKCGTYDQCYMESYVNSIGAIRYDFGCKDSFFCNRLSQQPHFGRRQGTHIRVCSECCNGTICNEAGCGNNAIPSRNTRGPLCFACSSQYKIDDCAEFKVCNRGEVCVLEEKTSQITGELLYKTDCMQSATCTTIYNRLSSIFASFIGKRNYDQSVHLGTECKIECCNDDFCNRACDITNQNANVLLTTTAQAPTTSTQVNTPTVKTPPPPPTTTTTTTKAPTSTTTTKATTTTTKATTTTVKATTMTTKPTTTTVKATTTTTKPTTTTTKPTTTTVKATTTTTKPTTTTVKATSPTTKATTTATISTFLPRATTTPSPPTTYSGCRDSLQQCKELAVLDSICHLPNERKYCEKSCHLCCKSMLKNRSFHFLCKRKFS